MSSALLRRNSSKAGLQNLLKVTAQRSIEDAEEVERERRRRAREAFHRTSSNPGAGGELSQDGEMSAEDSPYDGGLKPSCSPAMEEDEGFSDWTQRREKRRQQRMQELSQGAEEEEEEAAEEKKNKASNGSASNGGTVSEKALMASSVASSSGRLQRQPKERGDAERGEQPRKTSERRTTDRGEEEALRADGARREKARREEDEQRKREDERRLSKKREEDQRPETGVEKRKELKVSYTSKVVLHQEAKHGNANGETAGVDGSPCTKTKRAVSLGSRPAAQAAGPEEVEASLEAEQRLEKIRRSHQEKESQELEQLRHRQVEAEQELEELNKKREERRRLREEEERRREEGEQQRLAKEEEEKRQMKEDIERRRLEAAERMKTLSTSSVEGEEFSPFSPKGSTHKITVRTESLNRSLRKSSSFKKTQPPVLLPRIDDKLEQYTHAIENSQETKAAKQGLVDIPNSPEAVASKKNLFEAGEAGSPTKGTPCKDTEGLKVGVADLITQWVKGTPDGKQSPSRPNDVKPGDVMQKKNMWEIIGDTSGRSGQRGRGTPSGKRYKFVVTGHGKYEKLPVDDEDDDEYANGKSDLCGDY